MDNDRNLAKAIELDLEKSKQNQTVITATYFVLGLCMLGYLAWANSNIKPVLNEEFAARLIASHISVNVLPTAQPKIENYLVSYIPEITGNLMEALGNDLSLIRKSLVTQILATVDNNLHAVQKEAFDNFDQLLNQYDDELRAALIVLQEEGNEDQLTSILRTILVEQYYVETKNYTKYLNDTFMGFEEYMEHLLNTPYSALSDEEREERYAVILALANIESLARGEYDQSIIFRAFSNFAKSSRVDVP